MGVDRLITLADLAGSKQAAIQQPAEFIPKAIAKIMG
jgi:hypothetical protein